MPIAAVGHDPRRDVATRVPDLLPTCLLDGSACAFRRIQGRRDLGTTSSTGRPAASGRPPTTVVGRSSHHQRTGPNALQPPSPAPFRPPAHAAALARRSCHTTVDLPAATIWSPTHTSFDPHSD